LQSRTREYHIGHIPLKLVRSSRTQQILTGAVKNFLRMFFIKNGSPHRITEPVTGRDDAMIEKQPSFICQKRYRTRANLRTLPGTFRERSYFHHTTMFSPILHIRTETYVYVTERCMPIVTGTAQHSIFAAYFLREKHPVAIERQESILTLKKFLEIKSIGNANRRPVITVTPCHPITVLNPSNTGVILIFRFNHLRISRLELYRFMADVPMNAVFTESRKDIHLYGFIVTAEHTCKSILERNDCTIEN